MFEEFWMWINRLSQLAQILGGGGLIGLIGLIIWLVKRKKTPKRESDTQIKEEVPTLDLSLNEGRKSSEHTIIRPTYKKEFIARHQSKKFINMENAVINERIDRKRISIPVNLEYQKTTHKTAKNVVITLRIYVDPKTFDVSHKSTSPTRFFYSYFKAEKSEDHIEVRIKPNILKKENLMSDEVQTIPPFYLYYGACKDFENPETIMIEYEICAEDFKPGKGELTITVIKDSNNTPRDGEGYQL